MAYEHVALHSRKSLEGQGKSVDCGCLEVKKSAVVDPIAVSVTTYIYSFEKTYQKESMTPVTMNS